MEKLTLEDNFKNLKLPLIILVDIASF